jgi:hypothetical protein
MRSRETYSRDISVALRLSAFASALAPALPIWLPHRLRRGEEGQGYSWRDMPPAQSRARATYPSDVSIGLLLSAFDSAAAPLSPIWLPDRLQRGKEGQGCS